MPIGITDNKEVQAPNIQRPRILCTFLPLRPCLVTQWLCESQFLDAGCWGLGGQRAQREERVRVNSHKRAQKTQNSSFLIPNWRASPPHFITPNTCPSV